MKGKGHQCQRTCTWPGGRFFQEDTTTSRHASLWSRVKANKPLKESAPVSPSFRPSQRAYFRIAIMPQTVWLPVDAEIMAALDDVNTRLGRLGADCACPGYPLD